MGLALNLGCATDLHPQHWEVMKENEGDWVLVDLYVQGEGIENWDATKLDEVKDGSVDHIYASHLLEHFPHVQLREILTLWKRKLRDGGKLTLNVPDLVWVSKKLLELTSGKQLDGYYHQFEGEHGLLSIFYGNEAHEGEYHKSGFTEDYLRMLLKEVGFRDITVRQEVEAHDMNCLISVCLK